MTNHSFTCPLIRIIIASSDRNNPDRSIPTRTTVRAGVGIEAKFQSYQSKQINPDLVQRLPKEWRLYMVSIVSIQTDQSRPVRNLPDLQNTDSFQSYQSRQINPDMFTHYCGKDAPDVSIVSIQTDQSRQQELLVPKINQF